MKEKELFTTVAKIFVAETRKNVKTGHFELHVVMMAETRDTRYRFKTFGPIYDLADKGDMKQVDWLAKIIGMENMCFPQEELVGKYIRVIVERTKKGEYEPRAFGYNGADLFYLHNGDGEMITANEALQSIREK